MPDPIYSPDGTMVWSGTEWVPAESEVEEIQKISPQISVENVRDSVVQNTINVDVVQKIDATDEVISTKRNIRIIQFSVVGIVILLSIPLIMNMFDNDHEIVGEWENYHTYMEDGENVYCRHKYHSDGEMTASCYLDDQKKWTWEIDGNIYKEQLTWMFNYEYRYSIDFVDDVMFKRYMDSDVNSENNCSASVRYGVVNSEAQWRSLVASTEKPSFCDHVYGIDATPRERDSGSTWER